MSTVNKSLFIHTRGNNKTLQYHRNHKIPTSPTNVYPSINTEQLLTPPNSPEATPRSTTNHKKKTNNTYEYNTRILNAKRNGNIRVVMNEFLSMKKNNIQLTQHTYNLVLEAQSILRREGTPLTTMLKIYSEMIQAKIQPNAYTYIVMIRTLCKRDVEVQKTVAMLKRQSARVGHENEDVGPLESECNLSKALAIFHSAVADGITTFEAEIYNQLLRVLSHYGDTENANFVYHQLEQPYVQAKPNSATYAALINLFGRAGDIDTALHYYNVYQKVKDTLGPHDISYIFNALVDCHLKCNLLEGALHIVEHEMVESGIQLNCIPYNSIIRHYCAHDQIDDAEALIQRLVDGQPKYPLPDASSYGPILSAYCRADNLEKASNVYHALRKTDISKAYGNLVNYALLCLNHQDCHTALTVIDDMTNANLEPDPTLAERIIMSFAEKNQISEAIGALNLLQHVMSPRTLSKGCTYLLDSALEIVLHCASITQVLQVMHSITALVKNNDSTPSYVIMCKTLVDSYFDPSSQKTELTTQDFELLFDACFMVENSPGDTLIQFVNDMRHFNITPPKGLYQHVLAQIIDQETRFRWQDAFDMNTHPSITYSCTTTEEDDDIIIEVAEQDVTYLTVVSESVSNDILKAVISGNSREALQMFEDKIIIRGLIPTPSIMRDVIIAAGKRGDLSTAITIYDNSIYAFKDIEDTDAKEEAIYMVNHSLLIVYAQNGDMNKARVYHDRIRAMGRYLDSNGYASMLLGSAKCATDEATDALAIYDEAKRHNVKPTTFFYNVILSKLAKARKLDAAMTLFKEMKQFHVFANAITYGVMISASVRSGSETQSCRLFAEMLSSPFYQPRVGPFNNMMQLYIRQHPNRDRVIEYFSELRRRNIKPSSHSYKLLMEAYTHIAPYDMPMAHKLLSDMVRRDGLRPQATHYATLIYSYGILQRDVQSAERVFIEMKKANIDPDEAVYQAMIDTFISNDALEKATTYYQAMASTKRHCGSPYIENLFIRGYGEKGMLEEAEHIFQAMSDDKSQQTEVIIREPSTYEAMIRAYLKNGQTEKAKSILDKMVKRNFPSKVVGVVADLVS